MNEANVLFTEFTEPQHTTTAVPMGRTSDGEMEK